MSKWIARLGYEIVFDAADANEAHAIAIALTLDSNLTDHPNAAIEITDRKAFLAPAPEDEDREARS